MLGLKIVASGQSRYSCYACYATVHKGMHSHHWLLYCTVCMQACNQLDPIAIHYIWCKQKKRVPVIFKWILYGIELWWTCSKL